jgi:glycine/D-amino acid oxidase-like deaminating enzyme/nitrite reductase/ring-hydroxylating ferredoxin subunit
MDSKTPWQTVRVPHFPTLRQNLQCDVVVIGAGITGLTAACFLKRAGKKVCVLERDCVGAGDTGCTTAHLTHVTDLRMSELVANFGKDPARLVWEGGKAAIDAIDRLVEAEGIGCQFVRVPGFLHASLRDEAARDETEELRDDCRLANELGFDATFLDAVPHIGKPGIRFANQAKFHPLRYLAGLARAVDGGGCSIHEQSAVAEFAEGPRAVVSNGHRVECEYIVIATHVPLMGESSMVAAILLQAELAAYSSYAIGAKIPKGRFAEASYWDTSTPYYYLRIDHHDRHDYAIMGGEDHKTGQVDDAEPRYRELERQLRKIAPQAAMDRRWSGQVIETHDGLPYMGETAKGQFVATGFGGNGMTFGTLAGIMACDAALGRQNRWQELFNVDRKSARGAISYLRENIDYPYYLVGDRLKGADGESLRDVKPGEGKILELGGQRVACSRDKQGHVTCLSATCTHMGCIVHWNATEGTWDCPCHGSRFQVTGEIFAGPAETSLRQLKVAELRAVAANGASSQRKSTPAGTA